MCQSQNQFLGSVEHKNNMAKSVGAVVAIIVVALVLMDVVLLIGVVATGGVCILTTSGRLFKVVIVTIPAMHVVTNIMNQIMIL